MTQARNRDHLGVGWAFPVRPKDGQLTFARYEDDVEQAIGIVLETTRRERLMRTDFGADLRGFVFDCNSLVTHRAVESEVQRALSKWEPRITVQAVRAYAAPQQENVLQVEIDYVIRRNNASYNLVYPFYLTEGV